MPKWGRANIAQMPTVGINILWNGAAMLFSCCPVFTYIMNILFVATFDVSHEYSAAFYVTRMFRYIVSSSLFYLICCNKLFCPADLNSVRSMYSASSGLSKFNSVCIPIDAQVNAKLKAKIWANEYFDFALLLCAGSGDTRYHLSVSSQSGSSLPTLSLEPTQKSKPITSIETWTSAFQVFVGVYTVKYPLEALSLMKYGKVVRDLAARGGD